MSSEEITRSGVIRFKTTRWLEILQAQDEGPGPLVRAQAHIAVHEGVIGVTAVEFDVEADHVAAQRKDRADRICGPQAVPHEGLVDRNDVRYDPAVAPALGRAGRGGGKQQAESGGERHDA